MRAFLQRGWLVELRLCRLQGRERLCVYVHVWETAGVHESGRTPCVMVPHVWLCWPRQPPCPQWRLSQRADGVSSQEESLTTRLHTQLQLQRLAAQDLCCCWFIACHQIGFILTSDSARGESVVSENTVLPPLHCCHTCMLVILLPSVTFPSFNGLVFYRNAFDC